MFYELEDTSKAAALFEGWDETIIWSCLEQVMGHVFVDDSDKPKSAMAMLGDFCFLRGNQTVRSLSLSRNVANRVL